MPEIKLVVVNENTLGYILPNETHKVGILHTSILKGQTIYKDSDGWMPLYDTDKVRLAKPEDFDEYGCIFSDAYKTDKYKYDK
jgi:hypothetical protein